MPSSLLYYDRKGEALSTFEFSKLMGNEKYRQVARDVIWFKRVHISTVWLGIDHNFGGKGKPVLFETMIFVGEKATGDQWRYHTEKEAKAGHKKVLQEYRKLRNIVPVVWQRWKAREKKPRHERWLPAYGPHLFNIALQILLICMTSGDHYMSAASIGFSLGCIACLAFWRSGEKPRNSLNKMREEMIRLETEEKVRREYAKKFGV